MMTKVERPLHIDVRGFPGRCRFVEGSKGRLYINGYIESAEGDRQLIRVIERFVDRPAELPAQIPDLPGHYSLAFVTSDLRAAYLITNRHGSEPVYYSLTGAGKSWSFAIKDMLPEIPRRSIDERGLDEVTRYRWLAEESTLIAEIRQVLPGHVVCLQSDELPRLMPYARFDFQPSAHAPNEDLIIRSTSEALDQYLSRVRRSHSHVAVLFSGGVDSSLLIAKARNHNFDRLIAVTAGFPGRANPEAERATAIARHLGIEHRIIDISDEFVAAAPAKIVAQLERPSPYQNNIARACIFEQISGDVSFALTGEGADAMFSGSDAGRTAIKYHRQQQLLAWLPWKSRTALAGALSLIGSPISRRISRHLTVDTLQFIREKGTLEPIGRKPLIGATDLIPQLERIRTKYDYPYYQYYEPTNPKSIVAICQNRSFHTSNRNQFYCYSKLASEFGISVGHPFVAPEVAAIGLALPDSMKWDKLGDKPILKKLACQFIPPEWVYTTKLDFGTPYLDWLRGPLAPQFQMLFDSRTISRGLFDKDVLQSLDPGRDSDLIWTAINLELFARAFIDAEVA
jgi:asparagine synthase (glutamine-hydrolysing)